GPARRPPGSRHGERGADAAHRRCDLRHRGEPHDDRGRRPRAVAPRWSPATLRQPGGAVLKVSKQDVLDASKGMLDKGLVAGTAGNVSGRLDEERVCLTPSSVAYETM